jgi:predicted MFS family arabinose efflux permease
MATVAADLVPARHRGTGMGVYGLAMPLAMAVGPMLGAWLLTVGSFDLVFAVGTGIALAAALGYGLVRVPGVRDPGARLRLRSMFEGRVASLAVVQTLLCAGFGGWMTFIPIMAPDLGLESAGPLFFWYAVGGLTSRVFAGRWYDLRGPVGPAALTIGLLLTGWVGFATSTGPFMAQACSAVLGLGFGTAGTVFLSMAIDLVEPQRRGAASATFFSAFDVGIGGGAMVFGLLVELPRVHLVFWWAAGLTLVAGALLAAVALPRFRRDKLGL